MQETDDMQNEDMGSAPQNNAGMNHQSEEGKQIESYKNRLAKERRAREDEAKKSESLARELSDLKRKFDSGSATTNESSTYINTESAIKTAQVQGIHPDDLPLYIEDHMQKESLKQKMADAVEKDPELRALMNDPSAQQKVPPNAFSTFKHLDNPMAVMKHLLTDPADLMVFKAAQDYYAQTGNSGDYYQFLSNLSKRLDSTAKYPHPTKFKEVPDLSDVGQADSFDSESYITKKYKR